jgi:hypothetical protein
MKSLASRRARVARVRQVQHLAAVGAASVAEGRLAQLEANEERLQALRATLVSGMGASSGAAFAQAGELAQRLEQARVSLQPQINSAREAVTLRLSERQTAHIAREGADRLQVRAVAQMHREIEERMIANFRPRPKRTGDDG